jgi:hypothetical protein
MDLPKSRKNKGQVALFFKGFPEDVRFKSHTIPESLDRAKGTLYETWFNALKLSPYYQAICETGEYPSEDAEKTFQLFGDLRLKDFDHWWIETGYGIFAEQRPFNRVSINNETNSFGENVPVLRLEIPLNVSPKTLRNQFDNLLALHHPYYKDFDRWNASTANVRMQSKKLTSASLDLCLEVYKSYLDKFKQGEPVLYEIGEELRINPKLKVLHTDRPAEVAEKRVKMSSAVSEYLEKAKNLVAFATEGMFPCTDNHSWIPRQTRSPRMSKYLD